MATAVLNRHDFPEGTSVSAWPAQNSVNGGPPAGSSIATATVTSGVLTFTGLTVGTRYIAYAAGRGVQFRADEVLGVDSASPEAPERTRVDFTEAAIGGDAVGAVNARVDLIREAPLNVMDERFGAVGGPGTTNDTAPIQEAWDLAYSSGGGGVLLPERNQFAIVQLAQRWDASTTVNLIGGGKKSTVLKKFGATTTPVIDFSADPAQLETYSDICDLSILGVGKVHHGIQFDANARLRLTNVDIRGCDRAINNLGGLVMVLTGVNLQGNNDGLVNRLSAQVGGPPPNIVVLSGCVIVGNTHRGIDHGRGSMLVLCDGTNVESNGTAADLTTGGLYVQSDITTDIGFGLVVIRDSWFEGNLGRAIQTLSGDLHMDTVNLLSSEGGRVLVASGTRSVTMRNCHAPSTGDTVTVGGTFANFEDCVIHTLVCTATDWQRRNVQGSGANTGEFSINGDVHFKRYSASVAQVGPNLFVDAVVVAAIGLAGQVAIGAKGPASEPGFSLGSGEDTKGYRSAGGILAVQDAIGYPVARTAASVANNTLFRDSADNKLKYKDTAGVTNVLY